MVPGKMAPKNWSPEKFPSKIVLRQKNARKFKQNTQKNVWRLRHDPTYVRNCRTLKEFRKICCRVLGFHRLITSEHSTYTPRCSTLTPWFFVSGFGFFSAFCVCCRVLGFYRLITSQHSTHIPRRSTPTPRFFISEFPGDHFSEIQENIVLFLSNDVSLRCNYLISNKIHLRHSPGSWRILFKTLAHFSILYS